MKKIILIIALLIGGRFAVVYSQSSQIKISAMEQSIKEFKQLRKQAAKFEDTDTAKSEIAIIDSKIAGLQKAILDEKIKLADSRVSLATEHKEQLGGTGERPERRQKNTQKVEYGNIQLDRAEAQKNFEIENQKLYQRKMMSGKAISDSINGYMGFLINASQSNDCNFIISSLNGAPGNLDGGSHGLGPKQFEQLYLLPGDYICYFYINGSPAPRSSWKFTVSARQNTYDGNLCHFFVRTTPW